MKVLVADDDPLVAELLRTGLRARGWEVTVAADAMQAMRAAVREMPDAIVLDVNMPAGTGLNVLKWLKDTSKVQTAEIPVLVVSGLRDPDLPARVEQLGADEFLPKPVDLDTVYDALCRLTGTLL